MADSVVAAAAHEGADFVLGLLHDLRAAAGAGEDVDGVVGAVGLLISAHGHCDPVILRSAQHLALTRAHTHHRVGNAPHTDFLANGVALAQQVIHNVVAHNHVVGGFFIVGRGEPAAEVDVEVVERDHGPGDAADAGVGAGVSVVDDGALAVEAGADFGALGAAVADGFVVFHAEDLALLVAEVVFGREDDAGHLSDGEDVGAVADELGADVGVGAVDQRDDHDDRGHAHHHADQREDGAQLVSPQGLERESKGLNQLHGSAFSA